MNPGAICCQTRKDPICLGCGKPVVPGQGRWAGDPNGEWHYACAERAGKIVRQSRGPAKSSYAALLLSSGRFGPRSGVDVTLATRSASTRSAARSKASLTTVRGEGGQERSGRSKG